MTDWLKDSIFYEIYPQSFKDSNGDGIGDFGGIVEKLDYIKGLGFNSIWINPCYKSPFLDGGYDVSDHLTTAPRYGTNEELVSLFDEVHKRGMHVLLDLVPGHTSWEHPWFKESCKAEENEFSGRYIWSDNYEKDVARYPGIRGSVKGLYPRNGTVAVNFFTHQPALNYGFANPTEPWMSAVDSPEALATREAILEIMLFWLDKGCDGFRIDMAGSLVKGDEGQVETIKLWSDLIARVKDKYPDCALISEWGQPDRSIAGGYDMDFLLPFGPAHYLELFRSDKPYFAGEGSLAAFIETYKGYMEKTSGKGLICIPSGNHDVERMAKFLTPHEIKLAFVFLMTMPGAPFIYYGDEIGMRYLELSSKEGGYIRTGSRTPMQWTSGKNCGFSDADSDKLYLPVDTGEGAPNVEAALSDENSVLNELRRLIALRKGTPSLGAVGSVEFLTDGGYPLCYIREGETERALVCINPSKEAVSCKAQPEPVCMVYSIGGTAKIGGGECTIDAETAAVFIVK